MVYVEDAIPSTEDNHGVHTLSNFEHQEITHVEETTFPLDDRSREDLTSVSMDPASNRMVDDLVDSEIADDDLEQPSKPRISLDPTNEVGNETSYGLFGTSTASELEARADLRDQAPVSPRPPLPSIYNSPFAPQPGEATINSRPGTAKRTTPSHSRQSSQNVSHIQQSSRHTIESIQSSVPDPTNPNPPTTAGYRNQPHIEAKFTNKTNYTTGGRSSIVYGIDDYSALDACHFVSSAVEFGCSGSVRGAPNAHTPPNGQGAG